MQKMPEFYRIFARKILFLEFFGAIPGSKAESERIRPQHQLRDNNNNHRLNGSSSPVLTATCLSYGSL